MFKFTSESILFENNPSPMYIYDTESLEMVGEVVFEFFHPDDIAAISESHDSILKSSDEQLISYRFKAKDGSWLWVETILQSIRHPIDNEVIEIHAASRDITRRKRLEENLIAERN